VMEYEPDGKAAEDIRQLYAWTCRQVGMPVAKAKTRKKVPA
jgi:chromosome partitioning protein